MSDDTGTAHELVIELLDKLEAEADHAADNAREWGPSPNNQVRIWQAEADEKQAFADALRIVLGLPQRAEQNEEP